MATLAHLRHGQRAIITAIDGDDPRVPAKFAARGIVPGASLGVLRGGDPMLIGIDNERWAVNALEAEHIHVDVVENRKRSLFALLFR